MESTEKFSGLADVYTVGRPTYAAALFECMYTRHGFSEHSVIADIGGGTGKFTKQLLDRGSFVYCVEPNGDMRRAAVRELGGYERFRAVNGTAAETALEDHSVDFVTAAQAFHWFDAALFRKEAERILKKGGRAYLIWNMRDLSDAVNQSSFALFSKYCPNFRGFSGGMGKDDPRIGTFFGGKYQYMEFDHPLIYASRETFINRGLSSSYSLKPGDAQYGEYVAALGELFDRHAKDGVLTVGNETVVYFGLLEETEV